MREESFLEHRFQCVMNHERLSFLTKVVVYAECQWLCLLLAHLHRQSENRNADKTTTIARTSMFLRRLLCLFSPFGVKELIECNLQLPRRHAQGGLLITRNIHWVVH